MLSELLSPFLTEKVDNKSWRAIDDRCYIKLLRTCMHFISERMILLKIFKTLIRDRSENNSVRLL